MQYDDVPRWMREYKYWIVPCSVSNPPPEAWEGEMVYDQGIANSKEITWTARPAGMLDFPIFCILDLTDLSISFLYVSINHLYSKDTLQSWSSFYIPCLRHCTQAVDPALKSDTLHQCFPTLSQLRQLICCGMNRLPSRSCTSTPLNGM